MPAHLDDRVVGQLAVFCGGRTGRLLTAPVRIDPAGVGASQLQQGQFALILTLLRIGNPRRQRRERALGIDQRLTFQRVAWERRAFAHLVGSKLGALLGEQRSTRPKQQCRRQPHPCRRADRRVLRYGGSSAKAVQSPFPSCA